MSILQRNAICTTAITQGSFNRSMLVWSLLLWWKSINQIFERCYRQRGRVNGEITHLVEMWKKQNAFQYPINLPLLLIVELCTIGCWLEMPLNALGLQPSTASLFLMLLFKAFHILFEYNTICSNNFYNTEWISSKFTQRKR